MYQRKHKRYQIPLTPRSVEAIEAFCAETKASFPQATADFVDQISTEILHMANALKMVREGSAAGALRTSAERLIAATQYLREAETQIEMEMTPKEAGVKKAS